MAAPKWLAHLLRKTPEALSDVFQVVGRTPQRAVEVFNFLNDEKVLGAGGQYISNVDSSRLANAWKFDGTNPYTGQPNRMFELEDLVLSNAGLDQRGDLLHRTGGCFGRAQCNYEGFARTAEEINQDFFKIAEQSHIETTIGESPETYSNVDPHLIGGYLDELTHDAGQSEGWIFRPTGNLQDILKHEREGIVAAHMPNFGNVHLTAFRGGKQVVPGTSHLIPDTMLYDHATDFHMNYAYPHSPQVDNTRIFYLITRNKPRKTEKQTPSTRSSSVPYFPENSVTRGGEFP